MKNARRSRSTEDQYRSRVRQLQMSAIERRTPPEIFELTSANPNDCTIPALLAEFEAWSKDKTRASWDLYRAAVLWHMRTSLSENPSAEGNEAYLQMNSLKHHGDKKTVSPHEVKKPKALPKADLDKIINALLDSNQPRKNVGVKTQCWLLAGLATGLRPNEWETAHLKENPDGQWALHVDNSKRKTSIPAHMEVAFYKKEFPQLNIKNRFDIESHGFERISISRKMERAININEKDLIWVQNHLAGIAGNDQSGGSFQQYFDSCRHALFRACEAAFNGKKRYTLYVMRHQFAANMKNIYSKEEVADLMGHDDEGSAPKHYASRKHGHAEFLQARQTSLQNQSNVVQITPSPTSEDGMTPPAEAQT